MTALRTSTAGERAAPGLARVAFITGCGRSGTTVLGRLLSKHRDVAYLNDQHMLWAQLWPQFDVAGWVPFDPKTPAPLALGSEDARSDPAAASAFRAMLAERRTGRRLLVEKLAQNNMRMPFLRALVPDSLIINIIRHGVHVAHSIVRRVEAGRWYGPRDRKRHCLAAHAASRGYAYLLPLCETPLERALLEWRMSVDAADDYFERERPDRALRLRYEDLVADPVAICRQLESFLGISERPVMRQFAETMIRRQAAGADLRQPAHAEEIAGPALRRLGYWS